MPLGDGLTQLDLCEAHGVLVAVGYASSKAYCQRSDDAGATLLAFNSGATVIEIGASDDVRPAIVHQSTGALVAAVIASGVPVVYQSYNGGETWAVV